MTTLQSAGIGSGLDVNGLVTQLVAGERAPKQAQITKQQADVATKISALGSLKGALGTFQAALASLKSADALSGRSAKSGDDKVFGVSAAANAVAGSYGIKVVNLASAQQITSTEFASGPTQVVGNGLLKIELGTKSFTVNVVENSNDTLEKIRDSINAATDNVGVRAAIVTATDGAHLVLTSSKTGVANQIKITTSEGNGGLAALTFAPGNENNFTQLKPAADAKILIAGFERTSDSNVVANVVDGVTLTLLKTSPLLNASGSPLDPDNLTEVSLDVAVNLDTAQGRINGFVAQYNALASTLANLQSFDATTKKAGALIGDALVRSIESDVRGGLTRPVETATGAFRTLASLGITTKKDGTLEVNTTKLKAALESDLASVASVFSSAQGLATRLDGVIAPRLASTGDIATRNKTLDQRTKALTADQAALEKRLALVQQRFLKQFSALDNVLARMQTTSSFLTQQLAKLPSAG
jgi:flagellar hook-associated protein 2